MSGTHVTHLGHAIPLTCTDNSETRLLNYSSAGKEECMQRCWPGGAGFQSNPYPAANLRSLVANQSAADYALLWRLPALKNLFCKHLLLTTPDFQAAVHSLICFRVIGPIMTI